MGEQFQVCVGDVFHLWCHVCTPPKYKFFVVAYAEPRIRYMLINSQPAPFQQGNVELMGHQIPVSKNDHGFLEHDSYLDCSQLLGGLDSAELESACSKDHRVRIGKIAALPRATLLNAVASSRVLTERDKRLLLDAWQQPPAT